MEIRSIRNYSFEQELETLSVFRRFDYLDGVMVMNLNLSEISKTLDVNQIYPGSYTLVALSDGNVLFGSSDYKILEADYRDISEIIQSPSSGTKPMTT